MKSVGYPIDVPRVISERFASLTPKQQIVARCVLENPFFVAFASAADLAERVGVDAATVVRTCQTLGYTGWRQLQEAVRDGRATRGTFADRVAALQAPDDGDVAGRVFATALDNVAWTFGELDTAALDGAVAAVTGAHSVLVVGGGVMQGPALFLNSSLQLLGFRATLATTALDAGPALGALSVGDAVIGLSVWRYLRSTTRTLELAAEAAMATIAITDSPLSSAGLVADHVLVAHTSPAGPRLGLAGITTLAEALVARVALAGPERAVAATQRADALYAASGILEHSDSDAVPRQPRTPSTGGAADLNEGT